MTSTWRSAKPTTMNNGNLLLNALPAAQLDRLRPSLVAISVPLRQMLYSAGERIEHVYFPGGGFASLLTPLDDGSLTEVMTVGREGMVGISAAFDDGPISHVALVQAELAQCLRMTVADLRVELSRREAVYDMLMHYSQAMTSVIMQSTACNARHVVEQRLARWLLLAHDRIGSSTFPLTQEFVAMMLGASRQTVAVIAGTLQQAGMITYRHGQMAIIDRGLLESAACECYAVTTETLAAVPARARERAGKASK